MGVEEHRLFAGDFQLLLGYRREFDAICREFVLHLGAEHAVGVRHGGGEAGYRRVVEDDVVVKEFESVADALRYLGKPTKEAGNILRYADKYNKNGKRARTFGYSWVKL